MRRRHPCVRLYDQPGLTDLHLEDRMHNVEGTMVDDTIFALVTRCLNDGFRVRKTTRGLMLYPPDKSLAPIPVGVRAGYGHSTQNLVAGLLRAGMSDPTKEAPVTVKKRPSTVESPALDHFETIEDIQTYRMERFKYVEDATRDMLVNAMTQMLVGTGDVQDAMLDALAAITFSIIEMRTNVPAVDETLAARAAELEVKVIDLQRDYDQAMEMAQQAERVRDAMKRERDEAREAAEQARKALADQARKYKAFQTAMKELTGS